MEQHMKIYWVTVGCGEVKLLTKWTDGKAKVGRVREEKARRKKIGEEKARRKKIKEETVRRKKIQVREKVGKSRNTVFPLVRGSGGSKSRLAKAGGWGAIWSHEGSEGARRCDRKRILEDLNVSSGGSKSRLAKARRVRSHLIAWEIKNCTPLRKEAHFGRLKC